MKAPAYVEPMKALGVSGLPAAGEWLTEIKLDGFRALAVLGPGGPRLWSRNRNDLGAGYPEIVAALRRLRCSEAVLDGELVALDEKGRSRFQLLQRRGLAGRRPPILYYLFDLLHLNGRSLIERPLEERQEALAGLLKKPPAGLKRSVVFAGDPARVLAEVRRQGLEGVVLKRAGSTYEPGRRSGAWLKCRISRDQEFVIGGFTAPGGSRSHFGAILIGYYQDRRLIYAGKVGTGFDRKSLASLHGLFLARRAERCPFSAAPRMTAVTWLKPTLVAQIRFSEWTAEGQLRHPVFLGLRSDKKAGEVVREISAV